PRVHDANLVVHHHVAVVAIIGEERDDLTRHREEANVPWHALADMMGEPCGGDPSAPEIKRRVQTLTLGGPQPVAGLAHFLAPLRDAIPTFDAVAGLPVASDVGLPSPPPLPVVNAILITGGALALGRAGALGIAFTFRVAALFADGAVLLAL